MDSPVPYWAIESNAGGAWYGMEGVSDHVMHALVEKHLRERLAERGIAMAWVSGNRYRRVPLAALDASADVEGYLEALVAAVEAEQGESE